MGKAKGESRGLAYLQKARPEATSHLLSFFRESGRHLEPKTRFLISVVTKVINFSPRGLAQYVRRAIEAGATPDEILDAILCSYPCAGLTKVVDAIDVVLDLGLPGFEEIATRIDGKSAAAAESSAGLSEGAVESSRLREWVEVGTLEELSENQRLHVRVGGRDLAIFAIDGVVHAVDNLCPHRGGPLVRGHLEGHVLACPLHYWRFDVRTGVSTDHPGAKLGTYESRVEGDGRISVLLGRPGEPRPLRDAAE